MSIKPPIFKPRKPTVGPEIHYSERLKRTMRAHVNVDFQYLLNTREIREEELFSVYAQRYPDMVTKKLMTFMRVKIPQANWFELDEEGTLDSQHRVKEALVWSESKVVRNPENPEILSETFVQSTILNGVYRKPSVSSVLDEYGNPIEKKTRIVGYLNTYYIEFNEQNINDVLEKFGGKYRNTTIAYATQGESWYEKPYFGIPNFTEWMTEDFDLLAKAAQAGNKEKQWLTEELGGAQKYLKDKQGNKGVEISEKATVQSKSKK